LLPSANDHKPISTLSASTLRHPRGTKYQIRMLGLPDAVLMGEIGGATHINQLEQLQTFSIFSNRNIQHAINSLRSNNLVIN
jgi:hypothetical protein